MGLNQNNLTGQRLLRAGIINQEQLNQALKYQEAKPNLRFQQIVEELGFASADEIVRTIAMQIGIPYIDSKEIEVDPTLETVFPRTIAERYRAVPLKLDDQQLTVAIANPRDIRAIDDLRLISGKTILPVMASEQAITDCITELYSDPSTEFGLSEYSEEEDAAAQAMEELESLEEIVDDSPTVKLVNYLIQKAVADGASDIHIEPQEHDMRVRFRSDGVLHEIMRSPKSSQTAIISRLKIMSDIDISETRKPQDGHCQVMVGNKRVDFRVSTLPTTYGERVVLRILRTDSVLMQLRDLGFSERNLKLFETSFKKPYGCILVTGPTGSGKSTSLYAAINELNSPEKHILTAEDPVEYRLPGINQIQINNKAGLTFAAALRSFLRCSPDIILVGEIRDRETAQIAVEAALTGHLVLSTLHTNDAASAITRLSEMDIEPFLLSSAIDCVVAQRLARCLCPECKEAYEPDPDVLIRLGYPENNLPSTLWRAKGCRKCNDTGYKGRIGVHEILQVTEKIGSLTVLGATGDELKQAAIEEGMQTLRGDGLDKARQGITSIEEIMRVIA